MKLEKRGRSRAVLIAITLCLGIFSTNYAQYLLAALGPRYLDSIGIAPERAGTVLSSIMTGPLIPGIFLSLITGLLVDKLGAKRSLLAGFFISAAGVTLRIWADSYPFMLMCMVLIGVNATFMNANAPKIFGMWFPPQKTGLLMGIFLAVANAAMAAGTGTGALYPSIRAAFVVSAVGAVIAFVFWMLFGKDKKMTESQAAQEEPPPPVIECLKVAVRNRGVWIIAVSLMILCTAGVSIGMFLPTALKSRGFDEVSAGAVGMANTLGAMASCIITPILCGKTSKHKLMMLGYGIVASVGIMFGWRAPEGFPLVAALFFAGFFSTGLSPLLASLPVRLPGIGPKYAGTAGGFVATIQLIGGVVIPTYVITPISGTNFNLLFILFGVLMLVFCATIKFLPDLKMR